MFEFDRVQAGELDRQGRGAGDAGRGVVVGDVNLLHIAAGDHVALGGTPVPGDQHPARVSQRDDGGAVRQRITGAGAVCGAADRKQLRGLPAQELRERRGSGEG